MSIPSEWYLRQFTPPLVLGLCGRARHGKDFLAAEVKRQLEMAGLRVFLSSVSEIVLEEAQLRGLIRTNVRRADCDREELSALVKLGHEGRAQDEDFWIEQMSRKVLGRRYAGQGEGIDAAIVPGVRFPNEIKWLRAAGGFVARVARHNADGSVFISPDRDPNDPMETCLDRIVPDFEIHARTGQEKWVLEQAATLAGHFIREVEWRR